MEKQQKIILLGFLFLLAAIILLCLRFFPRFEEKRSSEEENVIDLQLWYPWENEGEAYKKSFLEAVEAYNSAHDEVQIWAEGTEMELYREKLPSAIASNDTPDIYFCFGDRYLQGAASSGKLLKMNEYLSEDIGSRLHEDAAKGLAYEGGIYGLGFSENIAVLFINMEMFESYGCRVPSDWDGLLEVCRAFISKGITPFACSGDTDTGFRLYLESICIGTAGGDVCARVLQQEGTVEEMAAFADGVGKFCRLRDMGAFGDPLFPRSTQDVENDFYLSKIPMYLAKSDFAGNIMQENSPLYGKLSAVPFPGLQNAGQVLGGISDAFVVNKAAAYPRETVQALEEILQDFALRLYERGAGIPVWDTGCAQKPEADIYWQIREIADTAENRMQYWEFYLDRCRAERFMKSSEELGGGNISPEQFVEELCTAG